MRIARANTGSPENMDRGTYDRITPLDIPPASIHLSSLSLTQLADLELQERIENYSDSNDFSIWTLASKGIEGINRITGGEMSLMASRDEEGDLSGIRFRSKRFNVATPVRTDE